MFQIPKFARVTIVAFLLAVAVPVLAQQLDPHFEHCHGEAMKLHEDGKEDEAKDSFAECMGL